MFTTSGDLANRFMHPRFEVEREYAVRISGKLTASSRQPSSAASSSRTATARFESLEEGGGAGANHWYRVVLREGRNRIVRRMFEAVGIR